MGWASGNEIFDPVCTTLVELIDSEHISEQASEIILVKLIKVLQDQDWDTEDESLYDFRTFDFIVRAFATCNISLEGDE